MSESSDCEIVPEAEHLRLRYLQELSAALREARARTLVTAIEAVTIGHKLGSAFAIASGELEQGAFSNLCDACEIPKYEAMHLIKLSKTYTLDEVRLKSGAQRQMMFALGCVPDKEGVAHHGDGSVIVSAGLGTATGHWRKYIRAVETGRATLDKPRARAQTKELYLWLKQLHEEP